MAAVGWQGRRLSEEPTGRRLAMLWVGVGVMGETVGTGLALGLRERERRGESASRNGSGGFGLGCCRRREGEGKGAEPGQGLHGDRACRDGAAAGEPTAVSGSAAQRSAGRGGEDAVVQLVQLRTSRQMWLGCEGGNVSPCVGVRKRCVM